MATGKTNAVNENGNKSESVTVTVNSSFVDESPDFGIHYISPDGTPAYAPFSSNNFTISVAKDSFLLPSVVGDVAQGSLSGGLTIVQDSMVYTRASYVTYLVFVSGDGTIIA